MNKPSIVIILIIAGLALGSFINALVWRLRQQGTAKDKSKAKIKFSILKGRSMCPKCLHRLYAIELVPVISWLGLRGKCRYCKQVISVQYPLVELLTTGLFLLSYFYWPLAFNGQGIFMFIIWLILLTGIIALAVYDIRWLTLPNKMIYPLIALVIIQIIVTVLFFNGGFHYIGDVLLGLLIGGGVFYILFQVSGGKWIGGGDVKLGVLLGLYLGSASYAILMIFFASVIGSLYGAPLLASGKINRKTLIPYGPFLILATIILRLFGHSITHWLSSKGVSV